MELKSILYLMNHIKRASHIDLHAFYIQLKKLFFLIF